MRNLLKNSFLKNYIITLVFLSGLEIFFRFISGLPFNDWAILRIFLGLNIISAILSYIISIFPKKSHKIILGIIAILTTIYAFVELGFNNFIGVYASFNTSSQIGAVTAYIKDFLASFLPKFYLIFIPFIILMIFFVLPFNKKTKDNHKKFILKKSFEHENGINGIVTIILVITFSCLYNISLTASFMQEKLQTISNKELFNYPSVPSLVINQFGVLGFGLLDIKSLFIEQESYLYASGEKNEEQVETSRVIDDTIWNKVIENETDESMNLINKYLINRNITDYNEYSGLFAGKNLIVIMMESVNDIIINKELYPNFYKMYSEGIAFNNNFSPRNSCATGNNEFSGMTGIYTIQNNCTANIYRKNTYYTSIFNLFNDAGYKTASMHNYTENYYYRRMIHRNLGSNTYYGVEDLGIPYYNEYKNWSSDEDFMQVAMDITLNNQDNNPFMLWLTTVSSHQPYKVSSVEGDKYLNITEGSDYPMDLRRYMSKLKTLDNSLGILLKSLEEANELDDTVIVMYGDHYPYGLKNDTINQVLNYSLDDFDVERTPMVIYNSTIESKKIEKYSSYINLTPTIANLFGLNYDPRLYMGSDVLSDQYQDLVVFADGSWKNKYAFYDASTSNIKYYTDKTYSIDEIVNINNDVTAKMQISASIIQKNYFNYLEYKLDEYDETLANIGG